MSIAYGRCQYVNTGSGDKLLRLLWSGEGARLRGNRHGLVKSMVWGTTKKHLDVGLIARIKSAVGIPLTLHGGSGTDDADLQNAITAGINIIHINTELRVAWRRGLEEGLAQDIYQVVPYKILPFAVESVKRVVHSRLQLFNGRPIGFRGKANIQRVA